MNASPADLERVLALAHAQLAGTTTLATGEDFDAFERVQAAHLEHTLSL